MPQTREQKRAHISFQQVQALQNESEAKRKAYGRVCHKLPVLIRQAGLVQALAFIQAKAKDGNERILDHLAAALHQAQVLPAGTRDALLNTARTAEMGPYVYLTREVQALLLWHKRYAQSVLGVEAGEDNE
jgi:CRISPR-associated protein Cmr5